MFIALAAGSYISHMLLDLADTYIFIFYIHILCIGIRMTYVLSLFCCM